MKVTHELLEGQVACVSVQGRLDAATVPLFEDALRQLLNEGYPRLVLDFSQVVYISSGGLRALLTTRRQARARAGDLVLCGVSARVRQVLDMVGFSAVFPLCDDVSQAVSTFAPPRPPVAGHAGDRK